MKKESKRKERILDELTKSQLYEVVKKNKRALQRGQHRDLFDKFEREIGYYEKKWLKTNVPTENSIAEIKKTIKKIENEIGLLKKPDCSKETEEEYERKYEVLREKIRILDKSQSQMLRRLEDYAKDPSEDYEDFVPMMAEIYSLSSDLVPSKTKSRGHLVSLKLHEQKKAHEIKEVQEQLKGIEELIGQVENIGKRLRKLEKSTHEWEPFERQDFILKPARIGNEHDTMEDQISKHNVIITSRKCKLCGKETSDANTLK